MKNGGRKDGNKNKNLSYSENYYYNYDDLDDTLCSNMRIPKIQGFRGKKKPLKFKDRRSK